MPMKSIITVIAAALVLSACSTEISDTDVREIRIVRDDFGVPHVYADSIYGLYYGYGYSIAQDRLFQMDMARRSTQGMVAEVLGQDYLDFDVTARTLFDPSSIRRQLDAISQADKDVFEGYAAGINAWLAVIREQPEAYLPQQFSEFGVEPSDWTAYDVAMIFIGTMNNRYGDYNTELENAHILASLVSQHGEESGRALFDLLNPRFTDDAPTSIPREDWSRPAYDSLAEGTATARLPESIHLAAAGPQPAGFSNVYLLGEDKVEGGGSIIVNGPQFGWFNPAYVYSIGMHGAGIDVVGNTPFGYPMIMFGHNKTIAWGSTWGASDIVDIYAEQLDSDDSEAYVHGGSSRSFEKRTEVFAVKDDATVERVIYRSVHGPIVSMNADAGVAYAKKRAWDGRELENLLAWLHATWAPDWTAWKAQAEKASINVNMYFADVDGNIGYFHGGWFPERAPGHDNRLPADGSGALEWLGRQSIDTANPHVLNPSTGFLANWNNKPGHGVMNPDFFFYSWNSADRVDFLHDALGSRDVFTPESAWEILETSSYADVFAPYFLPAIDEALSSSGDARLVEANTLLQSWDLQSRDDDGDGYYDGEATALFRQFVWSLTDRVLGDDLGPVAPFFTVRGYPTAEEPTGAGTNLPSGVKAIVAALKGAGGFDPLNGESAASVIAAAMTDALDQVNGQPMPVAARPFGTQNFLGIKQAADDEAMTAPIEQNRGTENNMIVLKPGAIVGWEVTPPGQSGFISRDGKKSPHYDDQFEMYYSFGRKRTWFYADDVEANKKSEITLTY